MSTRPEGPAYAGVQGTPRRLRVLYISQIDVARRYNGSSSRIQETLAHLARHHEVHLAYVQTPPGGEGEEAPARLPDGLASAVAAPRGRWVSKLFNRALFAAAWRIIERGPIDLVITEFGEAGIYGLALRLLKGVPFVYMSQNVEWRLHLQRKAPTLHRRAFAGFLKLVEALSVRCAVLTTTVTQADADVFRAWRADARILVLPPGFDAAVFNPRATATDPPRLLFVGNLHYGPNAEAVRFIADRVMDRVLAERPDVIFQFVGACPGELKAYAPRAEFVGFTEDLVAYVKAARLVLAPVLTGGGMRMKTVEALACGKMVIAAGRGADGIDLGRVRRLRLVEPAAFADAILWELAHGVADDPVDVPFLTAQFSGGATLSRFEDELVRAVAPSADGRRRPAPGPSGQPRPSAGFR